MERYYLYNYTLSTFIADLLTKVAYHGVPEKAYEVFVDALQSAFLRQGVDVPPLEDHNPAGLNILSHISTQYISMNDAIIM